MVQVSDDESYVWSDNEWNSKKGEKLRWAAIFDGNSSKLTLRDNDSRNEREWKMKEYRTSRR